MTNRSSLSGLLVAFDVTGLPPAKELIRRLVDTDLSGVDGLRGQIVIPVAGFCITPGRRRLRFRERKEDEEGKR